MRLTESSWGGPMPSSRGRGPLPNLELETLHVGGKLISGSDLASDSRVTLHSHQSLAGFSHTVTAECVREGPPNFQGSCFSCYLPAGRRRE